MISNKIPVLIVLTQGHMAYEHITCWQKLELGCILPVIQIVTFDLAVSLY